MKKTRSKILGALAALLGAIFALFLVAGFAACDGGKETTRFEAEEAALYADESDMMDELGHNLIGNYIEPFVFNVQEDENASGEKVVGYLSESNPTITFNIVASAAKSATLTLRGASAYLSEQDLSNWMGLAGASILEYKGSEHDILTVNGESVALSGTLPGAASVFDDDFNLNVSNWGELTAKINLREGANEIVITYDEIGLGVDYIELETSAELTYTETDNTNFANVPGTSGDDGGTTDSGTTEGGDENDDGSNFGGITDNVGYGTLTVEAENAACHDVSGKEDSTTSGIMKVEDATGRTGYSTVEAQTNKTTDLLFADGKNVGNFNTSGDQIVFEVYADEEISNVAMTVTAGCGGVATSDYDAASHSNVLSVNGTDVSMSGTVYCGGFLSYSKSWGYITATISLQKGINYITFTCDGTGLNIDCINLSWSTT